MLFGLYFYSFHPCVWWQVFPSHLPQLDTQQTNLSNTVQLLPLWVQSSHFSCYKKLLGIGIYQENEKFILGYTNKNSFL